VTRAVGAAAVVASIAIGGCGSCKDDKPRAAPPTESRSATIPGAGSARPGGPARKPTWTGPGSGSAPAPTAVVTKLTLAEATPALPAIPDAVIVDEPTEAPQGAQVHLAYCITAADQQHALASLRKGLTDGGWVDLRDRGQGARIAVTADKPPYRISASISASPRPGCSPADSQWFASMQMYKLQAVRQPPLPEE
jgi:hypothetical protein